RRRDEQEVNTLFSHHLPGALQPRLNDRILSLVRHQFSLVAIPVWTSPDSSSSARQGMTGRRMRCTAHRMTCSPLLASLGIYPLPAPKVARILVDKPFG